MQTTFERLGDHIICWENLPGSSGSHDTIDIRMLETSAKDHTKSIYRTIVVDREVTDEELAQSVRPLWEVTEDDGARLMVGGYDADFRELWEIPEAAALCRRMVRFGYLSFLDPIPDGFEINDQSLGPVAEPGRGMTAIGLWAIAREVPVRDYQMKFFQRDLQEFLAEIEASNSRVRRQMERCVLLPDGQHRIHPAWN